MLLKCERAAGCAGSPFDNLECFENMLRGFLKRLSSDKNLIFHNPQKIWERYILAKS